MKVLIPRELATEVSRLAPAIREAVQAKADHVSKTNALEAERVGFEDRQNQLRGSGQYSPEVALEIIVLQTRHELIAPLIETQRAAMEDYDRAIFTACRPVADVFDRIIVAALADTTARLTKEFEGKFPNARGAALSSIQILELSRLSPLPGAWANSWSQVDTLAVEVLRYAAGVESGDLLIPPPPIGTI